MQGFVDVVTPLHEVIKGGNGQFVWTKEAEYAFQTLKQRFSSSPILAMPEFTRHFISYTDASDKGFGGVLAQEVNGHEVVV